MEEQSWGEHLDMFQGMLFLFRNGKRGPYIIELAVK